MRTVFIITQFLFLLASYGQNHNNNWYFGNHAGITFNTTPPTAVTNGQLNTFEGCATISSSSGQLLFYTDGTSVYNKNHVQMANGYGLLGSWSATQSAIIVPKPGSSTLYYIFTVAKEVEANGFMYSIVDMSQNSGLGDVINKNISICTPVVEKVAAIRHSNGSDVWIVCHGWNNNVFNAYLLTSSGLSSVPVTSAVGAIHDINGGLNADNWIGYMKASPDRSKIAVAVRQKSLYEVFSFDNATGLISNPVSLINTQSTSNFAYGAYGLEFSPNSRYLYVKNFGPGDVFQYDLSTYNQTSINASKTLVGTVNGNPNYLTGAMQLGPDNKIYIVKYDQSYLAVINNPDLAGLSCNLIDNAISLGSGVGQLGLPSIIDNNFFNYTNSILMYGCYNDPYHFCLSDSTSITGVTWSFGDPASGSQNTSVINFPVHQFSGPGSYTIYAIVQYPGGVSDTLETIVSIANKPDLLTADSVQLCSGSSYLAQVQGTWATYAWSNSTANSTCSITQSGTYSVTVTDNSGCHVSDSIYCVFGTSYNTQVDTAFCDGSSISFEGQTIFTDGTYTFTYTTNEGCDSIIVLNVVTAEAPLVQLPADTILCLGQDLYINPVFSGAWDTYFWADGYLGTARLISSDGIYSINVNGACGSDQDDISVLFDSCVSEIWFPNVFTPNGDYHNPVFTGIGINVFDFHIMVFNRWGQMLFEANSLDIGWDGTFKGRECPEGVYFWIAEYSLYRNTEIVEETNKGSVTLFR